MHQEIPCSQNLTIKALSRSNPVITLTVKVHLGLYYTSYFLPSQKLTDLQSAVSDRTMDLIILTEGIKIVPQISCTLCIKKFSQCHPQTRDVTYSFHSQ